MSEHKAKGRPARKRTFKVWTWGDPEDELRRYGHLMLYKSRPRDAFTSQAATLTLDKPQCKGRKPKAAGIPVIEVR